MVTVCLTSLWYCPEYLSQLWQKLARTIATGVFRCNKISQLEQKISSDLRCLLSGGFFDGKTDADARRQYLLNLLNQTHKEQSGESEQNGLSDHQVSKG